MKMKRFTKAICILTATVIFMGTLSLGAWADNNPLQMMANGETWVDGEGVTWMPAPLPDAEVMANPYTGQKSYTWTIPKDTTFYTEYLWPLATGDQMTIDGLCATDDPFGVGLIGGNTWCEYFSRFNAPSTVTFTIQTGDLFLFYATNRAEEVEGSITITVLVTPNYISLS